MKGKTAVIAHDAGGAEVVSSYVVRQQLDCLVVAEGPARKIFARKTGSDRTLPLELAIAQAQSILCGTSWQSDLELKAIRCARSLGKHSVAFLDHWVNYRERFTRGQELILPDEIWVGDVVAYELAREKLPELPVTVVDNPYFADIRESLRQAAAAAAPADAGLAVLYVCEPLREHGLLRFGNERHWGYTEEEALRYFLGNVRALGRRLKRILIRAHPSEPPGKYRPIAAEFELPTAFSESTTLVQDVAASDCVVGCNSMAMVIGLLAGKRVISCIPPGGAPCSLPHPEIESLQRLL